MATAPRGAAASDAGGRRRERQLSRSAERPGWTRKGRRTLSHDLRDLSDKESQRWIATALAAKPLLAKAAIVTVLGDHESDIFALYASAAEQHFHVIARSMHDRKLADGAGLYAASEAMAVVDRRAIVLLRGRNGPNALPFSNCASAQ